MSSLNLIKIAKMAGVSRSTVSRVLNDHPNVSDVVRERVQKIIRDTGYQPNLSARALRSRRSNIIGLVLPQTMDTLFSDPYFPILTQGIAQACNQYKKTLALFIEGSDKDVVQRVTQKGLLDGFVIQSGKLQESFSNKLLESNIPFVVVGRPDIPGQSYIDVDNVQGAIQAVHHLQGLGYQKIAHITGDMDTFAGKDRLAGYRQAMQDSPLGLDENLILEGDFGEESAYLAAQSLTKWGVDAIFVASDRMARGAIRALSEAGLRVPEDVGIVGYDDLSPAIAAHPMMTTVRQPVREFGYKAVELLLEKLEDEDSPIRQLIIDVELIIRDSCGVRQRSAKAGCF
ncbi:MAG: LacI family transcriptional regulator [Chloroflexi bacterium HGW-Chloroflexi-3]|nr:MAG: LacI family transcriptional regulator [Chloroflexi bacterium HGW-Chloroflexi-3]